MHQRPVEGPNDQPRPCLSIFVEICTRVMCGIRRVSFTEFCPLSPMHGSGCSAFQTGISPEYFCPGPRSGEPEQHRKKVCATVRQFPVFQRHHSDRLGPD